MAGNPQISLLEYPFALLSPWPSSAHFFHLSCAIQHFLLMLPAACSRFRSSLLLTGFWPDSICLAFTSPLARILEGCAENILQSTGTCGRVTHTRGCHQSCSWGQPRTLGTTACSNPDVTLISDCGSQMHDPQLRNDFAPLNPPFCMYQAPIMEHHAVCICLPTKHS